MRDSDGFALARSSRRANLANNDLVLQSHGVYICSDSTNHESWGPIVGDWSTSGPLLEFVSFRGNVSTLTKFASFGRCLKFTSQDQALTKSGRTLENKRSSESSNSFKIRKFINERPI